MEYRQLGRSGVRVSVVALGTGGQWGGRVDRAASKAIVAAALDEGINYFDTADLYGTWYHGASVAEELLGEALVGVRERIVLGTKGMQAVGPGPNDRGASRLHLMAALENSLRRLRTDHVDLYQIHLPDPTTPLDETMRTLDDMVRAGKVRYVGASQYAAWQLCRSNDLAERYGWAPYITIQQAHSLLERSAEQELIPYCRAMGVGLLPFFVLMNGLLAGRYRQGEPYPADSRAAAFERTRRYLDRYATPANFARIDRLTAWAEARGHTLADLAIAWVLAEPVVSTVLAGASSPEQMAANARAAAWRLTPAEAAEVRGIVEE